MSKQSGKKSELLTNDRLPVVFDQVSRRMFIRGLGSALAIPFLPSLASRAFAQTTQEKYFIFMNVTHGRSLVVWNPFDLNQTLVAPNVRVQKLNTFTNGFGATIGTRFNDIQSKLSIIQGLDTSGLSDHYWFPWSASPSRFANSAVDFNVPQFGYSIDQVLAQSNKVYANTPKVPVLRIDPREGLHTYSFLGRDANGRAIRAGAEGKTVLGTWQAVSQYVNPATGADSLTLAAKKKFLVDQFLGETKKVMSSPELSANDKSLLGNFVDQLNDVQKRVGTEQPTPTNPQCATTPQTGETADNVAFNRRLMDIMALAMACGVTKVGTYHLNWASCMDPSLNLGSRVQPSVHDTIHHGADSGAADMIKYWQCALDHYGYMVRKMNQIGLLDNSVVVFTSDFSSSTRGHHGIDLPVITAGGLGGKLATGDFISYYDQTNGYLENTAGMVPGVGNKSAKLYAGRRYNEFLVSIMAAAGLTPADYERDGAKGFGSYECTHAGCGGGEGGLNGKMLAYQASGAYNDNRNATLPYFLKS